MSLENIVKKTKNSAITIAAVASIYFAGCKEKDFKYNIDWVNTHSTMYKIYDTNNSKRPDNGDVIIFWYDLDKNGIPELLTGHQFYGASPDGMKVYFQRMPSAAFYDKDQDGKYDYELTEFDKEGKPQKIKKYSPEGGVENHVFI